MSDGKLELLRTAQANRAAKELRTAAANQPAPEMPQEGPSCGRCRYMRKERTGPIELTSIMVCKRFPPQITITPVQQAGQTGVANLTGFPHVNASMWCWEYRALTNESTEGTKTP